MSGKWTVATLLPLMCIPVLIVGCGSSNAPGNSGGEAALASCGAGSSPETGVQGQVPLADRQSGRSQQGYQCNMERVSQFQGEGASWVDPFYGSCAYMATAFGGALTKPSQGVQVIDLSDPANPVKSDTLTSPSMLLGPWESLKVNESRGLLGAVAGGLIEAGAFFDVYDVATDCAHPKLLNSFAETNLTLPANFMGHEGNFTPDGKTYWSTGAFGGGITAIDVSDPTKPRIAYLGSTVLLNHGFELSDDGNRMYLSMGLPAGIIIFDVSDVQKRAAVPVIRQISSVYWNTLGISQHTIPVTYGGKPYLIVADEFAAEGLRFFDISDETKPVQVTHLQLEIQKPENAAKRSADTGNDGFFGYEGHYCTVDRKADPTALACGFFQSGIRVFNIVDPLTPREIAYYNPPAQSANKAKLQGSEHAAGLSIFSLAPSVSDVGQVNIGTYVFDPGSPVKADLSTDWCTSPPRFVAPDQLWVTCQDNGVMVLKFTNGVFPISN